MEEADGNLEDNRVSLVAGTEHLDRVLGAIDGGMEPTSACLQYAAELTAMWREKKCSRATKLAFLTSLYGEMGRLIGEVSRQDDRVRAWEELVPHMRAVYNKGERIA